MRADFYNLSSVMRFEIGYLMPERFLTWNENFCTKGISLKCLYLFFEKKNYLVGEILW